MTTEELKQADQAPLSPSPKPSPPSEAAKTEARDDTPVNDLVWRGDAKALAPEPMPPAVTSVEFEALQQRLAALEADVAFLRTYHAWPTKS